MSNTTHPHSASPDRVVGPADDGGAIRSPPFAWRGVVRNLSAPLPPVAHEDAAGNETDSPLHSPCSCPASSASPTFAGSLSYARRMARLQSSRSPGILPSEGGGPPSSSHGPSVDRTNTPTLELASGGSTALFDILDPDADGSAIRGVTFDITTMRGAGPQFKFVLPPQLTPAVKATSNSECRKMK